MSNRDDHGPNTESESLSSPPPGRLRRTGALRASVIGNALSGSGAQPPAAAAKLQVELESEGAVKFALTLCNF